MTRPGARRASLAVAVVTASLLAACGGRTGPPSPPGTTPGAGAAAVASTRASSPRPAPSPPPELPRGGRSLLPAYRLVAFYGAAGGPGLGVLGKGTPDEAAAAIEKQASAYAPYGRPVQPVMELITTVAQAAPGPDGTYSIAVDPSVVQSYLDAARRHRMLLILDFQPGRGAFLPQVRRYERFVSQPDVGVALDPEWRMKPNQVPGKVIGSARAEEVNAVSAYVEELTSRARLPQKPFVIHQFTLPMLPDRREIVARPGLAVIFHADGFGTPGLKRGVYADLALPGVPFAIGFKLFYRADTPTLTPAQAMALQPRPDLITYQ